MQNRIVRGNDPVFELRFSLLTFGGEHQAFLGAGALSSLGGFGTSSTFGAAAGAVAHGDVLHRVAQRVTLQHGFDGAQATGLQAGGAGHGEHFTS